jgi:hypothetical protein
MLTEQTVIDRIEIDERGNLLVRRATFILRDGVRLPGQMTYHRIAYEPGADISAEDDDRIHKIAALIWTEDVIAAAIQRREQVLATLQAGGVLP